MSDTGKTILWIAVAIVVIAVIIWLFVSAGRRRELEARRFEVGEPRARADERLLRVRHSQDRAPLTAAVAADTAGAHTSPHPQAERVDPDVDVDDEEEDLADAENPFAPALTASPTAGAADQELAEDAAGGGALGTGTATELHPDE